jgi:RHS repeat-associated protein
VGEAEATAGAQSAPRTLERGGAGLTKVRAEGGRAARRLRLIIGALLVFLAVLPLYSFPEYIVGARNYDDTQNLKTTTNERGVVTQEWLGWKNQTLTKIEDVGNLNITTQTSYDGQDQVVAQTDALNQTTITFYSPFGKPSSIVHPSVNIWESPSQAQASIAGGFTTTSVSPEDLYTYDDAGQLIAEQTGYQGVWHETDQSFDTAGRIIKKSIGIPGVDTREEWSWFDADGNLVKHADALLVSQIKAGQSDPSGTAGFSLKTYSSRNKVLTETDQLGAVVRYGYDFLDRKIQMKDPRSAPAGTDNFTINYSYNDLDRLVLADLPPVAGQGRGSETITYDLRGNVLTQVDPIGKTTNWSYDNRNRKTTQSVTGADGTGPLLSAWGYDAVGNTVAEIVASSINKASPGQSSGLVTTKVYDKLNRLTETDLPDGQKKITTYDALGRAIAVSDALGDTTHNTYNSMNKITLSTDPIGTTTYSYYDVWTDVTATQVKNPVNGDQIWVRFFNPYSQLLYEQNNSGQLWGYTYDPRGLVVGSVDPNGTSTVNTYTLTGLLTQKTLTNGAQTQSQSWSYDIAGSLMSGSDGGVATAINQGGGAYVPDPYDLVDSYATTIGSKILSLAYSYDNDHNPVSLTYPDGSRVNYQYNGLEELTAIPGYASNGQYNYMGRLTSLQAPNGTQRTKTWNASAGTLDGYNWNVAGKTARGLGWDVRGNLISQSKDGFNSSYVYDQLSRLEYAQEGGNIETLTDSTMPQGSQQRDVGGAKGLDFSNPGANVKLDYYASSIGVDLSSSQNISKVRLIGVSPRIQPRTVEVYISQDGVNNDWQKLTDTTWLQDETGVTLQLGALHQAQFVKLHVTWDERDQNNQAVDQHTLAGTVGQLLQVWYDVDGQTTSFTYDSLGNRVSENQTRAHSVQTNYSYYPNSSRIQQAGTWEFDYDANGNMTSRGNSGTTDATTGQFDWNQTQGELWQYGYDLKNRLVSVQHGLAGSASLQSVAQYTYDIRDLRVETVKPVTTTYTQYDQSGDLLWHDNGTQTRKYIEALGQIWAEVRTIGTNSQVYFHSTDHEGSTDVITDSSGNIVWDGDYEAFGSVVRSNGTIRFDASYTGKEFDTDTGLYYFNARFYDPQLGRFLNSDPARSGINWFAYVGNNPMSSTDPTGLSPSDDFINGLFGVPKFDRLNLPMRGPEMGGGGAGGGGGNPFAKPEPLAAWQVAAEKTNASVDAVSRAAPEVGHIAETDVVSAKAGAKTGPKPFGTGIHNKRIAEVSALIKDSEIIAGGQTGLPEVRIDTPDGVKKGRRPDTIVQRADESIYGINFGKTTRSGAPIKREAEALNDLEGAGLEMYFVPTDRSFDVPLGKKQ